MCTCPHLLGAFPEAPGLCYTITTYMNTSGKASLWEIFLGGSGHTVLRLQRGAWYVARTMVCGNKEFQRRIFFQYFTSMWPPVILQMSGVGHQEREYSIGFSRICSRLRWKSISGRVLQLVMLSPETSSYTATHRTFETWSIISEITRTEWLALFFGGGSHNAHFGKAFLLTRIDLLLGQLKLLG